MGRDGRSRFQIPSSPPVHRIATRGAIAPVDALGPVAHHRHRGGPQDARALEVADGGAPEALNFVLS
jgi:hypothetical protein